MRAPLGAAISPDTKLVAFWNEHNIAVYAFRSELENGLQCKFFFKLDADQETWKSVDLASSYLVACTSGNHNVSEFRPWIRSTVLSYVGALLSVRSRIGASK